MRACWMVLFLVGASLAAGAGEQLKILPPCGKGKTRFVAPTDLVWPEKPGEADVCLWQDDKFAATCVTIDDKCRPDHDWWLKLTDELGFKVTWFVMTDNVVAIQGCEDMNHFENVNPNRRQAKRMENLVSKEKKRRAALPVEEQMSLLLRDMEELTGTDGAE